MVNNDQDSLAAAAQERAHLMWLLRRVFVIGLVVFLVLFAVANHAYAATSAPTCPTLMTPTLWLLLGIAAFTALGVAALWGANRWHDVDHLLGHSMANSNLSALASTRVDTSCPDLQAANADLAAQQRTRRRVRAGTSHPQA